MSIPINNSFDKKRIGIEIGKGSYGSVYSMDDKTLVFKHYNKTGASQICLPFDFIKEASAYLTLKMTDNKEIIINKKFVGLTMFKYAMDLNRAIKSNYVKEDNITSILHGIVTTLANAQEKFLLHRDLKPGNIVLTISEENNIDMSVIDWGISSFSYSKHIQHKFNYVQTAWYRAPEQILKYSYNNPTIDMWSVGIIAIELINNKVGFFNGTSGKEQIQKYFNTLPISDGVDFKNAFHIYEKNHGINLSVGKNIKFVDCSDKLYNFIKKCISMDPLNRLDPISALEDPLFSDYVKPYICSDMKNRIDGIASINIDYSAVLENTIYMSIRSKLINSCILVLHKLKWSVHELSRVVRLLDKCMEKKSSDYMSSPHSSSESLSTSKKEIEYIYYYISVIITMFYNNMMCLYEFEPEQILQMLHVNIPPTNVFYEIWTNVFVAINNNINFKTFLMYDYLINVDPIDGEIYSQICVDLISDIEHLKYDDYTLFTYTIFKLSQKNVEVKCIKDVVFDFSIVKEILM